MIGLEKFDNLISLITYFKDNETCKRFLKEQRSGDDVVCPYCGHHHCRARSNGQFRCPNCLNNFSVLVGTIFENTKIALVKWFSAMYLISSHKKGISSHQLARDISVTQKTAWHILHKVRSLYGQNDSIELSEDVECDEAYIGGNEKNKHESKKTEGTQGRSLKTKTPVFGMAQRNGNIVALKTQDTKGRTLMPIIRQFVKEGSRIYTDEYIGYNSLVESEYSHAVVNHGAKQFVDGDKHTNTIEGFGAQLKRAIFGIYHFVSAKYLQRYVDEAVFRYNSREQSESYRFKTMFHRSIGIFRYADVKNIG